MNWLYFPRSKIFAKIRQLCWCDLKRWPDPIIASWNIGKKKAVFLKWFEKFNCLYYHELNFRKNTLDLRKSLENLLCFYREQTLRLFWWCHFKIWNCPVIARWSVHKNKGPFYAFTLKYHLPPYCELKFLKKCPRFNEVTWKFELLLFFRR